MALYLFTRDKKTERKVLGNLSFGGGCINDTIIHLAKKSDRIDLPIRYQPYTEGKEWLLRRFL